MQRSLKPTVRLYLLVILLLPLAGDALCQGDTGFLRGQGHADISLSFNRDTYRKFWIGRHVRPDGPGNAVGRVTRDSYTVFAAVGLLDEVDFQGSASYTGSSSDGVGMFPREDEFQDINLGFKVQALAFRLGRGEASLLAAPAVKLPMANYVDDGVTAIGDGQTDYRARVIAHYQLDNGAFLSVESGYDIREAAPKDELPLNVTLGITLFERVTIMPFYQNINQLGGYDIGQGPFPGTEEDYERAGVGLFVRIVDSLGVHASWRTTLSGRNTGDVDGFSVGLVLRF